MGSFLLFEIAGCRFFRHRRVNVSSDHSAVHNASRKPALIAVNALPYNPSVHHSQKRKHMAITKSDVEKIAELARLELTSEEVVLFTEQLSSILGHVEKLNELDVTDVPPMSHCAPASGDTEYAKRPDEIRPSLGQKLAVENAPDAQDGYFRVPKVIGG